MNAPSPAKAFSLAGNTSRGAVILGGAHGSLAIARSLGRRGIPVWFLNHDSTLVRFSGYVKRSLFWPGPEDSGALAYLLKLAEEHDLFGWTIFVGADSELRFVAENHDALSSVYRLTTPPWKTIKWTYDKRFVNEHAQTVGVNQPRTYYPRDSEDLAQTDIRFPVILKPRSHEGTNAFTLAKAWRADDRQTLQSLYAQAESLTGANSILLQELVPGNGENQFSYAAVWNRGEPIAFLAARRLRQYPIDFGYTSTFVETIDNEAVEAAAKKFLKPLNFSGLVEIEFKYDRRDGLYKILDVNARAWTWIALGALSGVDFPALLWRAASGENILLQRGAAGMGWMYCSRDLVAAIQNLRSGTISLGSYLASLGKPKIFAAFAKDDPMPGLIDLPLVFFRVVRKRFPLIWKNFFHA